MMFEYDLAFWLLRLAHYCCTADHPKPQPHQLTRAAAGVKSTQQSPELEKKKVSQKKCPKIVFKKSVPKIGADVPLGKIVFKKCPKN